LECLRHHKYPIVNGIPVMLLDDEEQTLGVAGASIKAAKAGGYTSDQTYFVETLGINEDEKAALLVDARNQTDIDPVVKFLVGATCGRLYSPLIGNLNAYPIPELRLPRASGQLFLDIGCNWGRWCVAAAQKGYKAVGIDPSLGAVLAARRVSKQLGIEAKFVVADARHLPFPERFFDIVFSYSVLQHFSRENVRHTLQETSRVLKAGGRSLIQMANSFGLRSQLHLAKRHWRKPHGFEVRYWSASELLGTFSQLIGPSTLSVDGYFGLGIQPSDRHLLPRKYQLIVGSSERLRAWSLGAPWIVRFADSLYVSSVRE
jgi:SAM-dependent methyltransferase